MRFTKILCPIDFSDGSRVALRVAAELARKSQATLVVVHVWEPPLWTEQPPIHLPGDVTQEAIELVESNLAAWKAEARQLGCAEVATKLLHGAPADQIVAAVRADPAIDLVVMGTHGRTGLKRALVGSVAETVVRHAPCAVMITRTRATDPASPADTRP